MKTLTYLFLVFVCISSAIGQEEGMPKARKNAVKFNALGLSVVKTYFISYERRILPQLSASIGYGRRFEGRLPNLFRNEEFGLEVQSTGLKNTTYNGEVRWYPQRCKRQLSMEGLYLGLFFKYNRYTMDADISYDDGMEVFENRMDARLNDYGVGISMGYQILLWNRLTLDFLFFGPRTSWFEMDLQFDKPFTGDLIDSVVDNIESVRARLLLVGRDIDIETTEVSAKSRFFGAGFRYAFSIGFAF